MDEYRSPFLIPALPACNNPEEAEELPWTHANRDGSWAYENPCPVHGNNLVSEWQKWAIYREAYATLETDDPETEKQFLNKMLGMVTLTNPPDANYGIWMETEEISKRRDRISSTPEIVIVSLILVALIIILHL